MIHTRLISTSRHPRAPLCLLNPFAVSHQHGPKALGCPSAAPRHGAHVLFATAASPTVKNHGICFHLLRDLGSRLCFLNAWGERLGKFRPVKRRDQDVWAGDQDRA